MPALPLECFYLALLASLITLVTADHDCCYVIDTAKNRKDPPQILVYEPPLYNTYQELQVQWDAGDQAAKCKFFGGDNFSNNVNCTTTLQVDDGKFLHFAALVTMGTNQPWEVQFGMNNNQCKYLHDDQVKRIWQPGGWQGDPGSWSESSNWWVTGDRCKMTEMMG